MASNIPISTGSGAASVATEQIGNFQFQQIKVVGGEPGSTSVMGVNPDRSINVSVIGTITTTATQGASVSGTLGSSVIGWVPTQPSNTSTIGIFQNSSIIAIATGSVVTLPTGNQSVSGTVGASVIGWVPTQPSNTSTIGVIQGSVGTVIIGGSIAASFTPPANQSVSGAVTVAGSVLLGSSNASVITVSQGSVGAAQVGTRITSIVSAIPSSVLVGASIFGQLPAGTAVLGSVAALQGTNPWVINGSVSGAINVAGSVLLGSSNGSVFAMQLAGSILATSATLNPGSVSGAINVSGSVMLGNSNGSVITLLQSSSILAVPVGSVITVLQAPSIVGTYAEDAAHTSGDKGFFVMQVRNDTMSSITSADGDYSPIAGGPVGETIVANSPITKWVQGVADFRQGNTGASIITIAAGGASVFTYITAAQVANMGPASVLVTFASGGSILGYTIAPAGGGSNIVYPNGLKTPANFGFAASTSGIASVLVSTQGFTSKT